MQTSQKLITIIDLEIPSDLKTEVLPACSETLGLEGDLASANNNVNADGKVRVASSSDTYNYFVARFAAFAQ